MHQLKAFGRSPLLKLILICNVKVKIFHQVGSIKIAIYFHRKVGKNKWPEPNYPMYCHGPCYMMTPLIAEKLLKNHQDSGEGQFKRFEDLYLTGK